jgi:hypothetical protein
MDPVSPRRPARYLWRGLSSSRTYWSLALAALMLLVIAGPTVWVAGAPPGVPSGAAMVEVTPQQYLPVLRRDFTSTPTTTLTPTPTPTASPTSSPTATRSPTPPGWMSASDFGLVFVNSAEDLAGDARVSRGASSGAKLDRFPIYWNRIETNPGQFTWESQDAALAADECHGLGALAILLGEPGFYGSGAATSAPAASLPPVGGSILRQGQPGQAPAACGPGAPSGLYQPVFSDGSDRPGPGKAANPNNPWSRFVDQAVQRYRPDGTRGLHVRYWEIWNEPDLCQFWSGTAGQYARLLKVAFLAIKNRDPQATVIWGGIAHYEQPNFLYDLVNTLHSDPMAAEFGGFFDAAGTHHYAIQENGYSWTTRIRAALNVVGWSAKPIWVTESGVPVCNDYPGPSCPSPWRAAPDEQASYIWQNVAYTRLAGGGPIFHFALHDDCGNVVAPNSPDGFGLVKNEATSYCSPGQAESRLAYTAYRLAVQYFGGTQILWSDTQQTGTGRAQRVAFYDPVTHERRLLIFDLDAGAITGRVPVTGVGARRLDLDGSQLTLAPSNGEYQIALSGATNRNWPDGQGGYNIGIYGRPYLVIEQDTLPPVTSMTPLPTTSPPSFLVRWSATDLGSSVAAVAIWFQRDEEPWQLWLPGQPANGSATFNGAQGHHYRFVALGTDRAGNATTALVAEAETWTTDQPPQLAVTGQVTNVRGQPAAGVNVAIGSVNGSTDGSGNFALVVTPGTYDVRLAGQVVIHNRAFSADTALAMLLPPASTAVTNGDFEAGLTGWTFGATCPVAVEVQPGSEDHALHLATSFVPNPGVPGEENSSGGNSTVFQNLHVPAGQPYLALRYRLESQEMAAGHDKFEVIVIKNNQPSYLHVRETAISWSTLALDLSAFAGSDVTLIFNVYQSSPNRPTSAYIDHVMIGQ